MIEERENMSVVEIYEKHGQEYDEKARNSVED